MMDFSWVDWDRRYFISTRGILEEVYAVSRQRWNQVAVDVNADAQIMDLEILEPAAAEMYYATFSAVDRHKYM